MKHMTKHLTRQVSKVSNAIFPPPEDRKGSQLEPFRRIKLLECRFHCLKKRRWKVFSCAFMCFLKVLMNCSFYSVLLAWSFLVECNVMLQHRLWLHHAV